MIGLLLGVALADPCGREVVVGRGLVPEQPDAVTVDATLDLGLRIRKRRVDGIPSWSVRAVSVAWTWRPSPSVPQRAEAWVGGREGALCEPETERRVAFDLEDGVTRSWTYRTRVEACRVRVVLQGTVPELPDVRVPGPTPPGPDAPITGPWSVSPGGDVVIDIPGCL